MKIENLFCLFALVFCISCGLPVDNESECESYVSDRNDLVKTCYVDKSEDELNELGQLLDSSNICVDTSAADGVDCSVYYDCLISKVECVEGAIVENDNECTDCN